jgi:cytochrome c2
MEQGARKFRVTLALLFVSCLLAAACSGKVEKSLGKRTGGDSDRGKLAMRRYGCGTCHTIPGVRGANGQVGPPLDGIATRAYVAGVLPNTPEHMIRWIQHPQAVDSRKIEHPQLVDPLTAMPDMGVKEPDALDMVAYLYTLK